MHKLPSLSSLRTFEAAARLGTFGLAADELSVTASAVSHQIKLLEEYTGVRLFHRINRTVVLTDVGRRYANEIAFAFEHMVAATQNVAKSDKSDILSIHSSPSFATQWLMPRLSRFSTIQPDIDVRLHAAHSGVDMVPEFDIDIRYGTKLSSASTVSVFLPEEVIVPMCAPALIDGPKPIHRPEDLRHHTLIHSEATLVGWDDWVRSKPNLKLNLKRGLRFDRSFMSIGAAVDGLGVCFESLLLVQREIEMKQLVMPFGMDSLKIRGHNIAYLTSMAELPKIKAFQNWLFSELAHTEQWKQRVIRVVQDRHIKS
jgi:LysR family transcriptional regulator, glycine cleavage system transcriptional activator